ncbi:Rieske 2Fe-2S domain-containing protein [Nocardioides sp. LHD-245]|uniref:Rieske (2Fe-2S) protein n=1 Tax=Nocardioides sp. LHD-245 TaxID=3051387 RepID=UPI0027DFCAE9|nr:Rieske 2Fe-2S domain-containing protein [Nocardioides sp. LHD-245]
MTTLVRLAALADVPAAGGLRIDRDAAGTDDDIALLRDADGAVYALDDTCTHYPASLARGWVVEGHVECPLHGARFDLRTGQEVSGAAVAATRTHRVVVRDEVVYLVSEA